MPGTYREQVVLNKGGDVNGYLTLKSLVKQRRADPFTEEQLQRYRHREGLCCR